MSTKVSSTIKFTPAKSIFFPLTFFVLNFTIVLIIFLFREESTRSFIDIAAIALWVFAVVYYYWKWTNTSYELKDERLFYQSGFTKGSIPVSSIHKIHTHSRAWGNIQAALTFRGLMVTFNKWDEIFIAPKDEERFVKELLRINPEIQIIYSKES